jgi:dTDP-4-amino-4,6-dideoxygalactose transaminase
MSNICAGIGRGQMDVLPERIEQRRKNFSFYKAHLDQLPGITFMEEPQGFFSNRWLTTILIDPNESGGVTREEVRLSLENENIESRPLWKPMHLQPVFKAYPYYGGNMSESLFENGLCLPSGSNLREEELDRVLTCIRRLFRK